MIAITNAASVEDFRTTAVDFPRMDGAMGGWMQSIVLGLIITFIDPLTGKAQESTRSITTAGILQPFNDEDLKILPEGDRSWIWYKLHALPTLVLNTNDKVKLPDGNSYRVMSKRDYSLYGYVEYNLQGDYVTA